MAKFSALAAIYAADVLKGNRTLDDVPTLIRDQVSDILEDSKKEDAEPQA